MNTLHSRLGNDRGALLGNTIVGSLLNLVVLGIIASAVIGQAYYQMSTGKRSVLTSSLALTDAALREDITWAGRITSDGPQSILLESTAPDGRCKAASWSVAHSPDGTSLQRTTSLSEEFTPGGGCGEPYGVSTETMMEGVDPAAAFTYTSPVDAASAAGIPMVSLEVTAAWNTSMEASHRITQPASGLYGEAAATDARSIQVPEGDLRR